MIATLSSRCAICSGRILKGRSRIERVGLRLWAHQRCADTDPDHQRLVRRRMLRAGSHAERSCPPD